MNSIMKPQFRLKDLLQGFLLLSVVFTLARIAMQLQVAHRVPSYGSVALQLAAGCILGLSLSFFLVRCFSIRQRENRQVLFATCLVLSITGLVYSVSFLSVHWM